MSRLVVSPAGPEQEALIVDSWAHTYAASPFAGPLPARAFHAAFRPHASAVLSRCEAAAVTLEGFPDETLGVMVWSMHRGRPILHHIWVKPALRRRGVGRYMASLLPAHHSGPIVTLRTKELSYVFPRHSLQVRHLRRA